MNYKVSIGTKIKDIEEGSGILALEPDDYSPEEIQAIRKKGYKVLGYMSVGTLEEYRPWFKEYSKYKFEKLEDWPDEYYVDVRKNGWRKFLKSRAEEIKEKGFDGWWCDNIDVYTEHKSKAMFTALASVFLMLKEIGGYVMINGGSEWVDDAIDRGENLKNISTAIRRRRFFPELSVIPAKGNSGNRIRRIPSSIGNY